MTGDTASPRLPASVKVRAALAAGLALGLGTGVTLASWSDAEYTAGSFASSTFTMQSSVSGSAFADNTAPGAAFTVTSAGMVPGVSVYVPVLLRTSPNSLSGTATLGGATLGGSAVLGAALVYRVVRSDAACAAGVFTGSATYIVGTAAATRPLTQAQESGTIGLPAAPVAAPSTPVGLCFEITLPLSAPSTTQDQTATASWLFSAVSS